MGKKARSKLRVLRVRESESESESRSLLRTSLLHGPAPLFAAAAESAAAVWWRSSEHVRPKPSPSQHIRGGPLFAQDPGRQQVTPEPSRAELAHARARVCVLGQDISSP